MFSVYIVECYAVTYYKRGQK